MRKLIVTSAVLAVVSCGASPTSSSPQQPPVPNQPSGNPSPPPAPQLPKTWDVETQGIPKFATHNYIDLGPIRQISRFRSGYGHDYWDDYETCRSMKHYFMTPFDSTASSVGIYAPFAGEVVHSHDEWAGVQLHIKSKEYPAFTIIMFHVNPTISRTPGTQVEAGQRIGSHIGSQTMSDVTIMVEPPSGGRKMISWFYVMTDSVFEQYRARGINSRDDAVISKAERDANPLTCNGEAFTTADPLPVWLVLN